VLKQTTTILAAAVAALAMAPVAQAEQGDWLFKVGGTMVSPKSNNLQVPGVGTLEVDDGTSLGLTITYMATDHVGVELLAAVPFSHDIALKGVGDIAETKHLPPTLSVQYHFLPAAAVSPYVGVGFNWTIFSSEKIDSAVADKLELDESAGFAAQAGVDLRLGDRWLFNADIRYIDIETDATITSGGVDTELGTVKIDPMVYSLMIGYRF